MSDDRKPAAIIRFNPDIANSPMLRQDSFIDLTMDDDDSIPSLPSPVLTPRSLRETIDPTHTSPRPRAPMSIEELTDAFAYTHERTDNIINRINHIESFLQEEVGPAFKKIKLNRNALREHLVELESKFIIDKNKNMIHRNQYSQDHYKEKQGMEKYCKDVLQLKNDNVDLINQVKELQKDNAELQARMNAVCARLGVDTI